MAISRNPVEVLNVLSNPKTCQILERTFVANDNGIEGHVIANHAGLSPSGFYSLMSSLRKYNMVEKKNQRYFITFFGMAAFKAKWLVQKALDNYHKLKVIDTLDDQQQIPRSELNKIIDIFIEDHQLKDILTNRNYIKVVPNW